MLAEICCLFDNAWVVNELVAVAAVPAALVPYIDNEYVAPGSSNDRAVQVLHDVYDLANTDF